MLAAKLLRLARRVQRVTEEHQPLDGPDRLRARCDLRRDAPAHRLAPDVEATRREVGALPHGGDRGAPRGLEHRRSIGGAPARDGGEEVEGDDVGPLRGDRLRHRNDPAVGLRRACAGREDEPRPGAVGPVDVRRGARPRRPGRRGRRGRRGSRRSRSPSGGDPASFEHAEGIAVGHAAGAVDDHRRVADLAQEVLDERAQEPAHRRVVTRPPPQSGPRASPAPRR